MDKPTCSTCPYWKESVFDKEEGQCRRHAPEPIHIKQSVADEEEDYVVWLVTFCDEWCGEHQDFPAFLQAQTQTPNRGEKE